MKYIIDLAITIALLWGANYGFKYTHNMIKKAALEKIAGGLSPMEGGVFCPKTHKN